MRLFPPAPLAALALAVIVALPACNGGAAGDGAPLIAISSGVYTTCALREDGSPICWGGAVHDLTPPEGETFVDISVIDTHACALRGNGSLVCWGDSDVTPKEEAGPFDDVSVGGDTCAIRREDAAPVCWNGGLWTSPSYAIMPEGKRFTAITVGIEQSCALREDGRAFCWFNSTWAHAAGNPDNVPLPENERFSSISSGFPGVCGVRLEDGAPICWGAPFSSNPSDPPDVGGLTAISVGYQDFACALREDGSPLCWGDYESGYVSLPADEQFSAINAGRDYVCAIRARDGSPVCWGLAEPSYNYGQASPP